MHAVEWPKDSPTYLAFAEGPTAARDILEAHGDQMERGRFLVEGVAQELSAAGFTTSTDVREGAAREMILAAAAEWQPDAIVIGSHGRTGVEHFFLGSVAEHVMRHALCPVEVVPPAARNALFADAASGELRSRRRESAQARTVRAYVRHPRTPGYDDAMNDTLATMIEYSRWADERLIVAASGLTDDQYCRVLGGGFGSVQAVVAHIAGAANAWRIRYGGGRVTTLLNHEQLPTVDMARRELLKAYEVIAHEAVRPAEELDEPFEYRNIQGIDVRVPRWAVLRHFVNHATYHRGQLASMLRILDKTPPPTDFMVWMLEQQATAAASLQ
jgi:uncharacterized damage-inducible protein DinB/nucleotide-binding universal stress UspA family protein